MNTVIIGAGNTATVLGKRIKASGHTILQVFSRNAVHAKLLAGTLDCSCTSDKNKINKNAGLYLIALSDAFIHPFTEGLSFHPHIVVHTAGAVSKEILKPLTENYGVFYPLQSLRKELARLPQMTLLIDAANESTLNALKKLAEEMEQPFKLASDEERRKYHLAAVMVNNFSNHLFTLTEAFCKKESLDFDLLLPVIRETVFRLSEASPEQLQTGPAIRNDLLTIDSHLALLEHSPEIKAFYSLFTSHIRKFYSSTSSAG